MKSYTIHLIRHGLTEGNRKGQYIGATDLPLAEEGVRQLEELCRAYRYPQAEVYYSSPMKRCLETVQVLYPGVTPIVVDGLRECSFGDWEGKTAAELEKVPGFLQWMENSARVAPPNGESGLAFQQRVCAAFEALVEGMLRAGTASAVVVAHGGTLMSILSAYGLPRARFYDWLTENGCGYTLRITPGLWMRSMVAEVAETIPPRRAGRAHTVLDLAREAADRSYGQGKNA